MRLSTHTGKPSVRSELMIMAILVLLQGTEVNLHKGVGVPLWLTHKAYGCQSSYPKRHRHIATVYLKGIGVAINRVNFKMLLVLT